MSEELQPGTYRARAVEGALGESGNGNPQVAVLFQILGEGFEGERITWFGSFSKNLGKGTKTPFQRTIETLRLCGWVGDDLDNLDGLDANEVQLVLDDEEYEGKVSLKVKWVNRPGAGIALKTPMTSTQAKAFAAKMRGDVLAASRGLAPQKTETKSKPAASKPYGGNEPSGVDDDIPF